VENQAKIDFLKIWKNLYGNYDKEIEEFEKSYKLNLSKEESTKQTI
jgi:hypothetical protein